MKEPLRVNPKSEHGPLFKWLATMISNYTNSHIHFDLKDMPEAERKAEIQRLKDWMEELLH